MDAANASRARIAVATNDRGAANSFYDCKGCGARLKPKVGRLCSCGSAPCPPIQAGRACGDDATYITAATNKGEATRDLRLPLRAGPSAVPSATALLRVSQCRQNNP